MQENKLFDKFKDLQKKNDSLELQAKQYLSTINELRTKAEGIKSQPAVIELSDRHYQSQTKTKGTYSDKDESQQRINLKERKSNCCTQNLEKLNKLEMENKILESEISKLAILSSSDISNFNNIIVESLEMLGDISKSIEILTPVTSSSYSSSKLSITTDRFNELLKHKKYLGDKYVKNNVFTERKESYENTKNKLKIISKFSNNSKGNNQSAQRPPSGRKLSSVSKKSSIRESNSNYSELERINILNEEKIEQREEEIQQKDIIIQNLRREIDSNKREILKLNNLINCDKLLAKSADKQTANTNTKIINTPKNQQKVSVNKNKGLNRTSKDEEKEKNHDFYKQQKESSVNDFQRIQNLNDNKESNFSESHDIHASNNQYAMKIKETSQKLDLSNSNANPFGAAGSFGEHSHKYESHNDKQSKNNEFNRSKISDNCKASYNRKDSDIITPKRTQGKQYNNSDDGSSFLSNFDELKSPLKHQNTKPKAIDANFLDGRVSGINAEMDSFNNNTQNNAAMLQFVHAVACTLEDYIME